jgi:hypothetical protein
MGMDANSLPLQVGSVVMSYADRLMRQVESINAEEQTVLVSPWGIRHALQCTIEAISQFFAS